MFIRLVSPLRKFLLSILLSLLQHLAFSRHGSFIVSILKEFGREEKQVVRLCGRCEVNPVDVMGRCVHFALQHRGDAYLVFQYSFTHFSLADGVTTLSCAAFQHQQSIFLRLLEQQFSSLLESLLVVEIESESPAWQFHAFHHALWIMSGIIKLYQTAFRRIVSSASQSQVSLLLIASTQHFILLFRGDGAGHLVPVLHPDQITAH